MNINLFEYPHIRNVIENSLVIDKNEYLEYEKIMNSGNIPLNLIKKLLFDSEYYIYTHKLINNEIKKLNIYYFENGKVTGDIEFNKVNFIEMVNFLCDAHALSGDYVSSLSNIIDFNNFKKENENKTFETNMYQVPFSYIFNALDLSNEEFERLVTDTKLKSLFGYPKNDFIDILKEFFTRYKILDNYLLPTKIKGKYDLLFVKKEIKVEDLYSTDLDEKLKVKILDGIKEEYTLLEKVIFIYIKTCKLLSLDEKIYSNNHDLNNINEITTNTKITSDEINLILEKFLEKLNIPYKEISDEFESINKTIFFDIDGFKININPVRDNFDNDLLNAKLNFSLNGIHTIGNMRELNSFNEILTGVYKDIVPGKFVNYTPNQKDILSRYKKPENGFDIKTKYSIIFNLVNSCNLPINEKFSYLFKLEAILFDDAELERNIGTNVVLYNENGIENLCAVVTINDKDKNIDLNSNVYYFYNPKKGIFMSNLELLNSQMNSGRMRPISEASVPPGVNINKKIYTNK